MPRQSTLYKQDGTDTFRLASVQILKFRNKPSFGDNLQNKDKKLSKCFIPDEGKEFFQADQAGAEALIVAYLCEPGKYRELFLQGFKVHVYVAMKFFTDIWVAEGFPEVKDYLEMPIATIKQQPRWLELDKLIKSTDKWEASKRYYYMAKRVCHSSNYGIGPSELAINLLKDSEGQINLSLTEVNKMLVLYHTLFPEIKRWNLAVEKQVKLTRTLRNLFGYPRRFAATLLTDKSVKDAFAWIPQSTVGVITHKAIVAMQDYIEANNLRWDILNNKHDSYLLQVPIGEDPTAKMQEFLEVDLESPRGEKFKMKSEVARGFNWGELH